MASYKIALVLLVSIGVVLGRPQDGFTTEKSVVRQSSPHLSNVGGYVGEIVVSSSHVAVKPKRKKSKNTTTPPPRGPLASKFIFGPEPTVQEDDGPRVSKFIGGEPEAVVDLPSAGSNSGVAVGVGPTVGQITGAVITFNNDAKIEQISK